MTARAGVQAMFGRGGGRYMAQSTIFQGGPLTSKA